MCAGNKNGITGRAVKVERFRQTFFALTSYSYPKRVESEQVGRQQQCRVLPGGRLPRMRHVVKRQWLLPGAVLNVARAVCGESDANRWPSLLGWSATNSHSRLMWRSLFLCRPPYRSEVWHPTEPFRLLGYGLEIPAPFT